MAKKIFSEVFPSSSINEGRLTVDDSVFEAFGLDISPETSPQQILAVFAIHLANTFPQENRSINPDETLAVTRDAPRVTLENGVTRSVHTFRMTFYRDTTLDAFDPTQY